MTNSSAPDHLGSIGDQATGFDEGQPPATTAATLAPGLILGGKYRIDRLLGAGGMGTVYAATDTIVDSPVALKMLSQGLTDNERARGRFLQEFRISQQLGHPNIVRAYAVDRHEGQFFYTMEIVDGRSLRDLLRERRQRAEPFSVDEAVELVKTLAGALEYAHRITVHRDIKPDNVLVTASGQPKLLDFGIAKALQSTDLQTRAASAMGTAYYMAPEQMRGAGDVDGRADIYSLGILLYELLVLEVPLPGSPPLSEARVGLPTWLDGVFMRSIAPREQRYASASHLAEDLATEGRASGADVAMPKKAVGTPVTRDHPPHVPPEHPEADDRLIQVLGGKQWQGGRLPESRSLTEAMFVLTERNLFLRGPMCVVTGDPDSHSAKQAGLVAENIKGTVPIGDVGRVEIRKSGAVSWVPAFVMTVLLTTAIGVGAMIIGAAGSSEIGVVLGIFALFLLVAGVKHMNGAFFHHLIVRLPRYTLAVRLSQYDEADVQRFVQAANTRAKG